MRLLFILALIMQFALASVSHAAEAAPKKKAKKTAAAATDDRGMAVVAKNRDSRKRVALIIGNSRYQSSPLKNPANDARIMARTLRKLGFDVDEKTDLNYIQFNEAVESFGNRLKTGGVGLFYYAGHGLQVQGNNYLVPVDAKMNSENEVRYKAVDAGLVLAKMEQAKSDVNIVVLDACRDNPFGRSFRNTSRGLANMEAPNGTIIAYATAPGKTASDGEGSSNGLYTAELVRVLETPGLKVEDVFKRVLKGVREKSGNAQVPWLATSFEGDFYFTSPATMIDLQPSPVQPEPVEPPRKQLPGKPVVEEESAPAAAKGFSDSITGMEFVPVPAGCFSANGTQVCLDAFRIGKYEVTQGQWQRVMGNNPSSFSSCGDDCPVEKVSWNDAQEFINRLNSQSGKRYRLPTEAEWEYACTSGGRNEEYCGGNNVDAVAWYGNNSGNTTHKVGTKQPNGLGIYDMSGNVWEWVSDWHGGNYPSSSRNPTGASSGSQKVLRGGSWGYGVGFTRAALRNRDNPDYRTNYNGFRLVVSEDK